MTAHKRATNVKENAAKREIVKHASRDDVHEQREPEQKAQGIVQKPRASKPAPQPRKKARS